MELPPDWCDVPLASVAEVRLGRQRSPKNHAGDQMRPYVRAANVSWSGLRLDDVKEMNFTDSEMDTFRLQPGDLLLGEASGSPSEVGKSALWRGEIADCAFQNTLVRVRPRGPDPEYLLHYFRHQAMSGKFAAAARGVGIHHLGSDALAKWRLPLPPLSEQRRIAEVLDRADALLTRRRETLALLDEMKRAIFLEMFLGGVQAGWPMLTVVDVALTSAGSIRTGPFGSDLLHSEFTDAGVAVLGIDNAVQNRFVWGSRRYISDQKYGQLKRYTVRPGDVLPRSWGPVVAALSCPTTSRRPSTASTCVASRWTGRSACPSSFTRTSCSIPLRGNISGRRRRARSWRG